MRRACWTVAVLATAVFTGWAAQPPALGASSGGQEAVTIASGVSKIARWELYARTPKPGRRCLGMRVEQLWDPAAFARRERCGARRLARGAVTLQTLAAPGMGSFAFGRAWRRVGQVRVTVGNQEPITVGTLPSPLGGRDRFWVVQAGLPVPLVNVTLTDADGHRLGDPDLLDVERFRRGLVEVRRHATEMRELVERAVAVCPLDGRRLSVVGGPLVAEIDTPKVERIVENLILNAVKHTAPGSSIEVRLESEGRDLVLAVEDDGPGVEDQYKEAVFETFNRGPSMLSATPGAGIGLALVARFAAVHGGRSWVEDRPGGGASFRVLLPDCVVGELERAS